MVCMLYIYKGYFDNFYSIIKFVFDEFVKVVKIVVIFLIFFYVVEVRVNEFIFVWFK